MRKGLIFSGGGMSQRQMLDIAQRADEAGVDAIYLTEAWRSAFVGLAALAMVTKRVEIGPCILNAYGRSPWITAMSAVDLDELCDGRLVLGVGTGNKHINEVWQGVAQERPLKKMEEYVTLLRKAVSTRLGETLQWQGEMHHMQWSPSVAPVRPSIPVTLSAVFPNMVKVAGRVADGISMGALATPEYIAERILPPFRQAAADAGRDPSSLITNCAPFVSVSEDRDAALQAAREAICHLYAPLPHPYYDHVLREQGFAKAADHAAKHVPEGRLDTAMEAFTDDIVQTVTVAGSLEECRAALARFDGVVDLTLFVNVKYSGAEEEELIRGYDDLIKLAVS